MRTHNFRTIIFLTLIGLLICPNFAFIHAEKGQTAAFPTHENALDTIVPGRMLSFKDSVFVGVKAPRKVYLKHKMKPKQTLNGLEKYYSISVGDLAYYNPEVGNLNAIPVNHSLRVPIPLNKLITADNELTKVRWKVVPILYKVKPKETIFRIAKVYFNMDIDLLKQRNGLVDNNLSTGQVLHIGWINVKGIPASARKYSGISSELRVVNFNLKKRFQADTKNSKKKLYKQKGIAAWSKKSSRDTKLYAMHRTAPIGSVIKVYAPSSKRTLYVKVMGKMSNNVYKRDVILYLSPAAAKSLGAVNERLRVDLNYHK